MSTTQLLPGLKPAEIEALRESIRRDGVIVPVVVRSNGDMIDGHHRRQLADELGVDYPTKVVDIDDETADRWRLILNLARRHLEEWERLQMLWSLGKRHWEKAKEDADTRKAQGQRIGTDVREGRATLQEPSSCKVQTRDAAAKALAAEIAELGVPLEPVSGKTLEKAKVFTEDVLSDPALGRAVKEKRTTPTQALKEVRKDARAEREAKRQKEAAEQTNLTFDMRVGDFRDVLEDLADGSVDLILTDPPYGHDAVGLYADLAEFAARKLKPGGSVLAYCGQATLPAVLAAMSPHLRYWWTVALTHSSWPQHLQGKRVTARWKPIVWFTNGPRDGSHYLDDVIVGTPPRKDLHEWAQGVDEVKPLVLALTEAGQLVVDPFAGSGSFGHAANQTGRHFIGSDTPDRRAS